jgi:putative serine protease PepD
VSLTNAHVVEGSERIVVKTRNRGSLLATAVEVSPELDLALLELRGASEVPLTLGRSTAVSVGADVLAVGSPLGLTGTVTKGIVSAIRRVGDTTLIQIDAAINLGNRRGPLLHENGTVVGINTLKV